MKHFAKHFALSAGDQPADSLISPGEAAKIFRRITGRRKSVPRLVEQIHHYPHLGVFEPGDYTGRPKLTAIRRRRWEYFVKARLCLWGRDDIFLDSEKSGTFFGN